MTTINLLILFSTIVYGCLLLIDHKVRQRSLISTIINRLLGAAPLLLLILNNPTIPSLVRTVNIGYYGLMLTGTLCGCWIPYILGDPKKNYLESAQYFKKEHNFSPRHTIIMKPTPLRAITDLLALTCFWLSLKL